MKNFRVGRKLAIGFGAVVSIIVASSTFMYIQTKGVYETERLNSVSDDAVDSVDKTWGDLSRAQSMARKIAVTGNEAVKTA